MPIASSLGAVPPTAVSPRHAYSNERSAADLAARMDRLPPTRHLWVLVLLISLGASSRSTT